MIAPSPYPTLDKPLYTTAEVAALIGWTTQTLNSKLKHGHVALRPTHQVNKGKRGQRFSRAAVAAYLESIRVAPDLPGQASPAQGGAK